MGEGRGFEGGREGWFAVGKEGENGEGRREYGGGKGGRKGVYWGLGTRMKGLFKKERKKKSSQIPSPSFKNPPFPPFPPKHRGGGTNGMQIK